jgi:hypothetical protein
MAAIIPGCFIAFDAFRLRMNCCRNGNGERESRNFNQSPRSRRNARDAALKASSCMKLRQRHSGDAFQEHRMLAACCGAFLWLPES